MSRITIQTINFIDQQITLLFKQSWFQEDIVDLRLLLLNKIPNHQIKEITLGADREAVRFQWLEAEFILNFDYYSQSCWFCAHNEISASDVHALYNLLIKA